MQPNVKICTECAKVLTFVWENKYYFIQKVLSFVIDKLFRDVFQTPGIIG